MKMYVLKLGKSVYATNSYKDATRKVKATLNFKEFMLKSPPPFAKVDKVKLYKDCASLEEFITFLSLRNEDMDTYLTKDLVIFSRGSYSLEYKEVIL